MTVDVEECLRGLPKKMKIGAYDWTVIIESVTDAERCGEAEFEFRQIKIWPSNLTGPIHAVGIVLHECLHVIFDNQGLDQMKRGKDEREEQIIIAYEAGLVSLYRDNPKLLIWMKRWLGSTR